MKTETTGTTTVRVRKETRVRLKKLSVDEKISVTDLLDKLVDEHEKSFWDDFDSEASSYLNKEELKSRKLFEATLKDGIG